MAGAAPAGAGGAWSSTVTLILAAPRAWPRKRLGPTSNTLGPPSSLPGFLAELDRFVNLHPRQHPDERREGDGQDDAEHDVDLGDVIPGGHHHELRNAGVRFALDL